MRGKTRRKRDKLGARKKRGHNIDGKRQEKHKSATSVKHLEGSFGTLPSTKGQEIPKMHSSNAGSGAV